MCFLCVVNNVGFFDRVYFLWEIDYFFDEDMCFFVCCRMFILIMYELLHLRWNKCVFCVLYYAHINYV